MAWCRMRAHLAAAVGGGGRVPLGGGEVAADGHDAAQAQVDQVPCLRRNELGMRPSYTKCSRARAGGVGHGASILTSTGRTLFMIHVCSRGSSATCSQPSMVACQVARKSTRNR